MQLDARKADAVMAVIETGSFEAAAEKLRLTTSAVSQRVRALETQLGVPLIVRSRPCRSTREGLKLVQYLRRAAVLAQEFEAEYLDQGGSQIRIAIAVNNDSLGTWLLPALAEFIVKQDVLVDILIDDQDFTHKALEEGTAIAAVSSRKNAMRGCSVVPLGAIRYRLLASPDFVARWFPGGISRARLQRAPLLVFDRKDALQSDFIDRNFGVRQETCRCHYLPSTEAFFRAVKTGIGFGMVPELHYGDAVSAGELVDLAPGRHTDVSLYWHHWQLQSPKVSRLTQCVVDKAREILFQ